MVQLDFTVGFIGAGAMGGAIAHGLIDTGAVDGPAVAVCEHHEEKRAALAAKGARVAASARDLVDLGTDVVVLAVKPQVLDGVLSEIAPAVTGRLVVSIAAGVPVASLEEALPGARVVRAMPNLPIQVQSGATALCSGATASADDVEQARRMFGVLGVAEVMREDQLDAEGAVIGCGPAYIALLVDAFTRAGVKAGLPAQVCRQMFAATMRGTAEQILQSGEHPRAYMEKVTSPGGTTAAGLYALEPLLVDGAYDAVDAALARTRELAG